MATKTKAGVHVYELCSSLVWDGELPPVERMPEVYDRLVAIGLRLVERREKFEGQRARFEAAGRTAEWKRKHARMMAGHRAVGEATVRLMEEMDR